MVMRRLALAFSALALLLTGCATPHTDITLPPRPVLIEWPQELIDSELPETVQATELAKYNDLAMKEYARRLERRIKLHNEIME